MCMKSDKMATSEGIIHHHRQKEGEHHSPQPERGSVQECLMHASFNQPVEYTTECSRLPNLLDHQSSDHETRLEDCPVQAAASIEKKSSDESVTSKRKLQCEQCGRIFSDPRNLKRHQMTHSTERLIQCEECGKSFCTSKQYNRHVLSHSGERPFQCTQCGTFFRWKHDLRVHEQNHVQVHFFHCPDCKKSYTTRGSLGSHQRRCHGLWPKSRPDSRSNAADISEKKSSDESVASTQNLPCHRQAEENGPSRISQHKPKALEQTVRKRKQSHAGEQPDHYAVQAAVLAEKKSSDEAVASVQNLPRHQEEPDTQPLNIAEYIRNCLGLSQAENTDASPQEYNKASSPSDKKLVKQHRFKPSGEHPHKCAECGRCFSRPKSLKLHQFTHTGERPYGCETCGRSFNRTEHLKRHQLVHSEEKPYKCMECVKSFSDLDQYKRHLVSHSGERPFQCRQCRKSYRWRHDLRAHERKHEHVDGFRCVECGKRYTTEAGCAKHQARFHSLHTNQSFSSLQFMMLEHSDPVQVAALAEKKSSDKSIASMLNLPCYQERTDTVPLSISQDSFNVVEHDEGWRRDRSFTEAQRLEIQKLSHDGKKQNECEECGKSFCTSKQYKRHLVSHSGERQFQCTHCTKSYRWRHDLRAHARKHEQVIGVNCPICDKHCITQSGFAQHHEQYHSLQSMKPELCDPVQAAPLAEMKYSDESVAFILNLPCHQQEPAAKPFSNSQESIDAYDKKRLDDSLVSSSSCQPVEFAAEHSIWSSSKADDQPRDHWALHSVRCPVKTEYVVQESPDLHDGGHDTCLTLPSFYYPYVTCAMSINPAQNLEEHQLQHNGKRPYQCEECGKLFLISKQYERHVVSHSGDRPFQCTQCGKLFRWKHDLCVHEKNHAKVNFSLCSLCGKRYTTKGSLVSHQRRCYGLHPKHGPVQDAVLSEKKSSHESEAIIQNLLRCQEADTRPRRFHCETCGRSFNQAGHLKRHQFLHSGERPYGCAECDKSFSSSDQYKRHTLSHSGDRPFQCTQCGKSYRYKHDLRVHERKHEQAYGFYYRKCEKRGATQASFADQHELQHSSQPEPHPVHSAALTDMKSRDVVS